MGEGEISSALRMVAALAEEGVPTVGSVVELVSLVEVEALTVSEEAGEELSWSLVVVAAPSARVVPVAAARADAAKVMVEQVGECRSLSESECFYA